MFAAHIYYYITTEFDYTKRDSRHAAYGGVVLQRFEFLKVCMGKNGNRHFSLNFDIFTGLPYGNPSRKVSSVC